MAEGFSYTVYDVNEMTQAEVYGQVLAELAEQRDDIVLLTADLARSTKTSDFFKAHPGRSFNFGVAEQNMMSAAAGLALAGKLPFVSTFGAFATMRACEQLRTDIAYNDARVRVVATHTGLSMAKGGPTHNSIEDLAIVRAMPNMTVIVPCDQIETAKVVRASMDWPGPMYVRIGRGFEPPNYFSEDELEYEIGKANLMREGADLTAIACGVCVLAACEAADIVKDETGKCARVLDMHTIKPIDREAVLAAARETPFILTAEEHSVIGGLGSAVAEVLAEEGAGVKLRRLGVPDVWPIIGEPEELYAHYGIDTDGLVAAMKKALGV